MEAFGLREEVKKEKGDCVQKALGVEGGSRQRRGG
jgi:hypothetical protein